MPETSGLLLLWKDDNVLVATTRLTAGATVVIDGEKVVLPQSVSLGHKIARADIAVGEDVCKYGAPIGRASGAIVRGEHVHVHNVVSNYTPTHTIDGSEGREQER